MLLTQLLQSVGKGIRVNNAFLLGFVQKSKACLSLTLHLPE